MDMRTEPRRRGQRGPAIEHDRETPAYRIIYGVFGSQSVFSDETGVPLGTVARWLQEGLIPARRQADVIRGGTAHGREIDPALFVPTPQVPA